MLVGGVFGLCRRERRESKNQRSWVSNLTRGEACGEQALGRGRTGYPLGHVRFEVGHLRRDTEITAL